MSVSRHPLRFSASEQDVRGTDTPGCTFAAQAARVVAPPVLPPEMPATFREASKLRVPIQLFPRCQWPRWGTSEGLNPGRHEYDTIDNGASSNAEGETT